MKLEEYLKELQKTNLPEIQATVYLDADLNVASANNYAAVLSIKLRRKKP
jgi:hypothetical protein